MGTPSPPRPTLSAALKFWILALPAMAALVTLWLWLARTADRESTTPRRYRLSDNQLRALAYIVALLICLVAALFELNAVSAIPEP